MDVGIGKKASNHEVLEANYRMKFEKYKIEKLPERPFCFNIKYREKDYEFRKNRKAII